MVRGICIIVILFYYFNGYVKSVHGVQDRRQTLDMITYILKSVQQFANGVQKLFNYRRNKQPVSDISLKYLADDNIQNFKKNGYYNVDNQSVSVTPVSEGLTVTEETTPLTSTTPTTGTQQTQQVVSNKTEIIGDDQMYADFTAAHLIALVGYKTETHTVATYDGYLLKIQRIIQDHDNPSKEVVILHHGLFGSSEDWLLLGPGLALPFLLTDRGYDVWLLNARGNKYSRGHTRWSTKSYDFWDFSWHEMGTFDLPAVISYIIDHTDDANLYFVGHSMGASALLVLLSTYPKYNDKLKAAIFLAPLAFMHHIKGPVRMFSDIYKKNGRSALTFLGTSEFLPTGKFSNNITKDYCKGDKQTCVNPLMFMVNGGEADLTEDFYSRPPGGGSAMTILHYVQLVKNRRFQMYDYGMLENLSKYKQKRPPSYNLQDITLSISLFTSPSDWLASTADVVTLLSRLKNIYIHHVIRRTDFNHMDFVWAKDAPELIFHPLLQILDQLKSSSKTRK